MKTISKNFRLFWQGTLLSYRALFAWLRPVTYMASKIFMPLAQMFFFVFLGTYASGLGQIGGLATAAVPEPGARSLVIGGIGAASWLVRRRHQRGITA